MKLYSVMECDLQRRKRRATITKSDDSFWEIRAKAGGPAVIGFEIENKIWETKCVCWCGVFWLGSRGLGAATATTKFFIVRTQLC